MGTVKILLESLSVERAFEHIRWLTEEVGERISGTEEERKAAKYLRQVMGDYGLETELQEFEVYNSVPLHAELKVLSPEFRVIEAQAQGHSTSTLPEGVTGELLYLGAGSEADYEGREIKGKIVLAELSYSPPRPEKARLAACHGAKALVIMNWGRDKDPYLPKGAVKAVWGNPTPENFADIPRIPVLGISRAAGEYLKDLLSRSEVHVQLRAECVQRWDKVLQPLGRIRGTEEPEKFVLVGGHFDAWGKGATCNAAGNGLMLELARVLNQFRSQLRRSVVFAFWNGHEIAEAAGSTWYVDNFWDDITENAVAYINVDSPGLKGTHIYKCRATLELKRFVQEVGRQILGEEGLFEPMRGKMADQSFYGVGVPSIMGRTVFDERTLEKFHGATLGWWYHSDNDTLDKIDKEQFLKTMEMNLGYIFRLCSDEVLPMEFVTVAEDFVDRLRQIRPLEKGFLKLSSLIRRARELKEEAEKLELLKRRIGDVKEIAVMNDGLIKLSRILLPVLNTIVGKYGQDSYGLSNLDFPIPALYQLEEFSNLKPNDTNYKLLWTKLLRERNRVADALGAAVWLIKTVRKLLG